MRLAFTDEQEELRASVRRLLAEHWSPEKRRAALESAEPYDARLWKTMAEGLGLHGMAIAEEYGGAGYGFVEQSIVLEEIGRTLLRAPYLTTVAVAATALQAGDDEALRARWLPRIAAGEAVATLADAHDGGGPAVTATRGGDTWRATGTVRHVVDGAQADFFVVPATGDDGPVLLVVDAAADGVTTVDHPTLDLTRRLATVTFAGASADVLATGDRARAVRDRTLDVAAVALACEQAGGSAAALEMTVGYARIREQFGAPIGSFQAIKFTCADMLLHLEAARSAAYYAAAAAAEVADDLPIAASVAASVAKAVCSDAYTAITGEMIQVHGGIGYTWEHDAHLYFKRAKASQHLFGDADRHRARLADLVGV